MAFLEECQNTGWNGKEEWSAEHRIGIEDRDGIKEIEELGFNLCVAPSRNKGCP